MKITISRNLGQDFFAFGMFLSSMWQALPKSVLRRLLRLQEHISLEILGGPDRVEFHIWVPYPAVARVVTDQMRAHFPDVAIERCKEETPRSVRFATAELVLGMSRERSLRTLKKSEADPMAGLLASVSQLSANEWAMVQIMVRPALAPSMEAISFQTMIRVAAGAESVRRARNRLGHMIAAFGQFGAENALKPRRIRVNRKGVLRSIQRRHWSLLRLNPSLLTLDELTGMYHLPSPPRVRNRYLEVAGARRLPPPLRPTRSGLRVGLVPVNGRQRELRLAPQDLLRHLAMLGSTGTGKSTLLLNMALDLIRQGFGVTVMDPHGSLISSLLTSLPEERTDDVIVIRFADVAYPV